ncbi:unnamed protein product [Lasius platythorax]|uniref:Uncharacterized protein n=1 Tax=Lasius platythorax TaxID=488582 RepID=A0AAV2N120_9HYME
MIFRTEERASASFGCGEDKPSRASRANGRVTPAVDDPCGAIEYLPTRRLALASLFRPVTASIRQSNRDFQYDLSSRTEEGVFLTFA